MQESYYSDNGRQYMILGDDGGCGSGGYEMTMIFKNHLKVFLPVREHFTNGNTAYEYDITGYSSLEEYGRRKGIGAREIDALLTGINELRDTVSEYMLDMSRVLLASKYIYINGTDVRFVYYTEKGKDFFVQLKSVWENILTVLDHGDKALVMKTYGVYQDMLTGIFEPGRYNQAQEIQAPVEYTSESIAKEEFIEEVEVDTGKLRGYAKIAVYIGMGMAVYGFLAVYADSINILELNRWVLFAFAAAGLVMASVSWLILHEKIKLPVFTGMAKKNKYISYQVREEEIKRENNDSTRILTLESVQPYLQNNIKLINKTTGQQIELTKFPAILGLMPDCNVILQGEGISRVHAVISKDADELVIEDMDSTNGTWVDGKRLVSGKNVRLEKGSVIRFAVWDYEIRW